MEKEEAAETAYSSATSLFPLFATPPSPPSSLFPTQQQRQQILTTTPTDGEEWLCNTSFTTNLSIINDAVSSLHHHQQSSEDEFGEEDDDRNDGFYSNRDKNQAYDLVEEVEGEAGKEAKHSRYDSDFDDSDSDRERKRRKRHDKKNKKGRKRVRDYEKQGGNPRDFGSRKSNVRVWVDDSDVSNRLSKDYYYFDTHGDRDNLVYGSLYRMDVPRYKPYNSAKIDFRGLYRANKKGSGFDRDGDVDALDTELKSGGRYWSAKYAAVERHKNLKRLRVLAREQAADVVSDDFLPLSEREAVDHPASVSKDYSIVEESWEDEVLRKTREFNKLSRERPHDEKVWLDFAEFQDKVASTQPQKGARLQTLEKKISILEKATELNPDNEDLLLCLLKAYQSRDSTDILIGRWEKVLMSHSGSYKLWKEYLRVHQGEFSRFKVSEMRKMYAHAIQAISTACSRKPRQVYQLAEPSSLDPAIIQLELGLVDIFLSLCRFEWQAGYQELATALFQAEIEFSIFCPSLLVTERSKLRLFEHFWNSNGPRVGEEGALGWSTWLEKEEENRQRIMKEETSHDDERGGWTGWSEPLSKHKETAEHPENVTANDAVADEFLEEFENEDIKQEDDTEALLKQLGIDVDAEPSSEVKNTSAWSRWSEEESLRDSNQWMPVHDRISLTSGTPDGEDDEHFLRAVLFEDVSECLFSLSSEEARLSLLSQFIEFFGVDMSQWICTNSSRWTEKILSLEVVPDSISKYLRRVYDIWKAEGSGNSLEFLVGITNNSSKRTDMMTFARNTMLLCLTAFPRNYILEEAALLAEEFSVTKMDSSTPCRALAKSLLKNDRQDVLLCGVYAQREAVSGNLVHARRAFDMALTSVEGLQPNLRSNGPLLYFWYAEAELSNSSGDNQESSSRALHILSCLGNGAKYSPFECKPSSLQLLRAHQGFKEKMRTVRSAWVRGVVDDQSIAIACSAALFEELTTGWSAGIDVLDEAFAMVLPDRRCHSYQLEFLFNYYMRMLLRHHKQSNLSKVWDSILKGLQIYPSNPELFMNLVEISHLYTTPNKLRWMFDDYCHRKPSVILWLFALTFEMSRGGFQHRIHGLFERALANERLSNSVILWRLYMAYEIDIASNPSAARRIFFRAIHACPWSKKLWLDGFSKLNSILTAKELSDLQDVMRDKELNLRTDIYEILLQDDLVS